MEPMPMPTRSPSTPQSRRCLAWRFVTTFPPMTCRDGKVCFIHLTISCWKVLSPWLLSTTMASTPAATSARTRSLSVDRVPTAAATTKFLLSSLVDKGNSACFLRSERETNATNRSSLVMTGKLPFLEIFKSSFAPRRSTPSGAVVHLSVGVMMELTHLVERSGTKSVSRSVTKPSSREPTVPSSVTGKPLKPHFFLSSSSSESGMLGLMHTGSVMNPFLNRFTFMTSSDCSWIDMLVWMTPMPPCKAIPIAILDSVTVSMGLETMGVFSLMVLENWESKTTSPTPKLTCPGRQIRSS
mmetsp:Transcript_79936/g.193721  ORF Transcript_79936/g.193721 Transcript_79936/m.193721 type:complete len:298 (+) Transcript_79936:709-1602(+)